MKARRSERGVSLIESTVALGVLALGLTGVLTLQLVTVQAGQFARRTEIATGLARDLVENASLWDYDDPRLATTERVKSLNDPRIAARTSPGRGKNVPGPRRPHFAEHGGPNANAAAFLRGGNRRYAGVSADVDGDGEYEFERYWSVFAYDPDDDGVENGKIVYVIVRWEDTPLGYREIVVSSFRSNARAFSL